MNEPKQDDVKNPTDKTEGVAKTQAEKTEIVNRFYAAPDAALFTREEIAAVRRCSIAKLDREAWLGTGIKFVRDGGRCLYRKGDVTTTLQTAGGNHAE